MKSVLHHVKTVALAAVLWIVSIQIVAACEQYQIISADQNEPVKSAITSLEEGSIFGVEIDFSHLQERTIKAFDVNRVFQQEWVSQRIEYEYCLALKQKGVRDSDREARLEELRSVLYRGQGFAPIFSTVMDKAQIRFAALGTSEQFFSKRVQLTETSYLWRAPFVLTEGNKHFVIVASVLNGSAAIAQANRLKRRHPDLDFAVYAPYFNNPYHGIMMATWVDYSTAREALTVAQKRIASDAYIWSCKSEGRFC